MTSFPDSQLNIWCKVCFPWVLFVLFEIVLPFCWSLKEFCSVIYLFWCFSNFLKSQAVSSPAAQLEGSFSFIYLFFLFLGFFHGFHTSFLGPFCIFWKLWGLAAWSFVLLSTFASALQGFIRSACLTNLNLSAEKWKVNTSPLSFTAYFTLHCPPCWCGHD